MIREEQIWKIEFQVRAPQSIISGGTIWTYLIAAPSLDSAVSALKEHFSGREVEIDRIKRSNHMIWIPNERR